jgi:hypothetical protein
MLSFCGQYLIKWATTEQNRCIQTLRPLLYTFSQEDHTFPLTTSNNVTKATEILLEVHVIGGLNFPIILCLKPLHLTMHNKRLIYKVS